MFDRPTVWSNGFFLAPLGLAISAELYLYSSLIFAVIVFSSLYHYFDQKKFRSMDRVFAYLLIGCNLYIAFLANFKFPYFLIALIFVAIGLFYLVLKKQDDLEWHLASSLITLFCLLAYVT